MIGPTAWPTQGWQNSTPASVGLDETVLNNLDHAIANGTYGHVDSLQIFRFGKEIYNRKYIRDYSALDAVIPFPIGFGGGSLNGYMDPAWLPYYHGTDLHTMQSITKSVTSAVIGVAITRGDFKLSLDAPLLRYFDISKVKNIDERKRHITLRNVLTMTSGLSWNVGAKTYTDPGSDPAMVAEADDWLKYVLDKPMANTPGGVFNYNTPATDLLGYIFKKVTGQDIDAYAAKYLFAPLGIKSYQWVHVPGIPSPKYARISGEKKSHRWVDVPGGVNTGGGLYLKGEDLAKIGLLFLKEGVWDGQHIISAEWVRQSTSPAVDPVFEGFGIHRPGTKYGYLWWLTQSKGEPVWAAAGWGDQRLMVFPSKKLIAVVTAWNVPTKHPMTDQLPDDLLSAVQAPHCEA